MTGLVILGIRQTYAYLLASRDCAIIIWGGGILNLFRSADY